MLHWGAWLIFQTIGHCSALTVFNLKLFLLAIRSLVHEPYLLSMSASSTPFTSTSCFLSRLVFINPARWRVTVCLCVSSSTLRSWIGISSSTSSPLLLGVLSTTISGVWSLAHTSLCLFRRRFMPVLIFFSFNFLLPLWIRLLLVLLELLCVVVFLRRQPWIRPWWVTKNFTFAGLVPFMDFDGLLFDRNLLLFYRSWSIITVIFTGRLSCVLEIAERVLVVTANEILDFGLAFGLGFVSSLLCEKTSSVSSSAFRRLTNTKRFSTLFSGIISTRRTTSTGVRTSVQLLQPITRPDAKLKKQWPPWSFPVNHTTTATAVRVAIEFYVSLCTCTWEPYGTTQCFFFVSSTNPVTSSSGLIFANTPF